MCLSRQVKLWCPCREAIHRRSDDDDSTISPTSAEAWPNSALGHKITRSVDIGCYEWCDEYRGSADFGVSCYPTAPVCPKGGLEHEFTHELSARLCEECVSLGCPAPNSRVHSRYGFATDKARKMAKKEYNTHKRAELELQKKGLIAQAQADNDKKWGRNTLRSVDLREDDKRESRRLKIFDDLKKTMRVKWPTFKSTTSGGTIRGEVPGCATAEERRGATVTGVNPSALFSASWANFHKSKNLNDDAHSIPSSLANIYNSNSGSNIAPAASSPSWLKPGVSITNITTRTTGMDVTSADMPRTEKEPAGNQAPKKQTAALTSLITAADIKSAIAERDTKLPKNATQLHSQEEAREQLVDLNTDVTGNPRGVIFNNNMANIEAAPISTAADSKQATQLHGQEQAREKEVKPNNDLKGNPPSVKLNNMMTKTEAAPIITAADIKPVIADRDVKPSKKAIPLHGQEEAHEEADLSNDAKGNPRSLVFKRVANIEAALMQTTGTSTQTTPCDGCTGSTSPSLTSIGGNTSSATIAGSIRTPASTPTVTTTGSTLTTGSIASTSNPTSGTRSTPITGSHPTMGSIGNTSFFITSPGSTVTTAGSTHSAGSNLTTGSTHVKGSTNTPARNSTGIAASNGTVASTNVPHMHRSVAVAAMTARIRLLQELRA